MKKMIYDFKQADENANGWYSPEEISTMLKDAALSLAPLIQDYPEQVCAMQIAVTNATYILDRIAEKEEDENE